MRIKIHGHPEPKRPKLVQKLKGIYKIDVSARRVEASLRKMFERVRRPKCQRV